MRTPIRGRGCGAGDTEEEVFLLELHFMRKSKDGPRRRFWSLAEVWSSKDFVKGIPRGRHCRSSEGWGGHGGWQREAAWVAGQGLGGWALGQTRPLWGSSSSLLP